MRLSSAGLICMILSAGLMVTASLAQSYPSSETQQTRAKPVAVGPAQALLY